MSLRVFISNSNLKKKKKPTAKRSLWSFLYLFFFFYFTHCKLIKSAQPSQTFDSASQWSFRFSELSFQSRSLEAVISCAWQKRNGLCCILTDQRRRCGHFIISPFLWFLCFQLVLFCLVAEKILEEKESK